MIYILIDDGEMTFPVTMMMLSLMILADIFLRCDYCLLARWLPNADSRALSRLKHQLRKSDDDIDIIYDVEMFQIWFYFIFFRPFLL